MLLDMIQVLNDLPTNTTSKESRNSDAVNGDKKVVGKGKSESKACCVHPWQQKWLK